MTVPIKPCAMAGSATVKDVKEWIWHKSLELSRVVGETQNDFVSKTWEFYSVFQLRVTY